MIKFGRVNHYKNKDRTGIYIQGHANFAAKGQDIVCAAVSAIGQTAAIGCQVHDESTEIKHCREGHILFTCKKTIETESIIKAALIGLTSVKEQYPKCFRECD